MDYTCRLSAAGPLNMAAIMSALLALAAAVAPQLSSTGVTPRAQGLRVVADHTTAELEARWHTINPTAPRGFRLALTGKATEMLVSWTAPVPSAQQPAQRLAFGLDAPLEHTCTPTMVPLPASSADVTMRCLITGLQPYVRYFYALEDAAGREPAGKQAVRWVETDHIKWCSGGGDWTSFPTQDPFGAGLDGTCPIVPPSWATAAGPAACEKLCAATEQCVGFTLYRDHPLLHHAGNATKCCFRTGSVANKPPCTTPDCASTRCYEKEAAAAVPPLASFVSPPLAAKAFPKTQYPLRVVVFGDVDWTDGRPGDPPGSNPTDIGDSFSVSEASCRDVKHGFTRGDRHRPPFNATLTLHVGDISYSGPNSGGNLTLGSMLWDVFLAEMECLSSAMPYMTAVGNHDVCPGRGAAATPIDIDGYHGWCNGDSGWECGSEYLAHYRMPAANFTAPEHGLNISSQSQCMATYLSTDAHYWHSYVYGPIQFVVVSTEHDFSPGSPQLTWLATTLAAVDRDATPWLVVYGHRPTYWAVPQSVRRRSGGDVNGSAPAPSHGAALRQAQGRPLPVGPRALV